MPSYSSLHTYKIYITDITMVTVGWNNILKLLTILGDQITVIGSEMSV